MLSAYERASGAMMNEKKSILLLSRRAIKECALGQSSHAEKYLEFIFTPRKKLMNASAFWSERLLVRFPTVWLQKHHMSGRSCSTTWLSTYNSRVLYQSREVSLIPHSTGSQSYHLRPAGSQRENSKDTSPSHQVNLTGDQSCESTHNQ